MFKYLFSAVLFTLSIAIVSASSYGEETQNINKDKKTGRILVIYYSLSGNTRKIAAKIKEKTNADLYEIKTEDEYPSSPMIYLTAKKQLNPKNYPKLKTDTLPDLDQYDLIFVGGPVWWYTVPAPLLSFFRDFDFKNKTVFSFATHGGNYGKYFEDFEAHIKNAKVIRGKDFKKVLKTDKDILDAKISDWLLHVNTNK